MVICVLREIFRNKVSPETLDAPGEAFGFKITHREGSLSGGTEDGRVGIEKGPLCGEGGVACREQDALPTNS